jgi:hypothetical protein
VHYHRRSLGYGHRIHPSLIFTTIMRLAKDAFCTNLHTSVYFRNGSYPNSRRVLGIQVLHDCVLKLAGEGCR